MAKLSRVVDREKLKPRRDPYWEKISSGCFLGFRKMSASSSGSWSARFYDEHSNKQVYKTLGDFSELAPSERFDEAQSAAREWFKHLGKGGASEALTVKEVCERYVNRTTSERGEKAGVDVQQRFVRYVYDEKIAKIVIDKLRPTHLEEWRKTLRETPTMSGPRKGKKRSDSALNRDMACLKAAFNLAYRDGLTTSDFAWRNQLMAVKNADRRRRTYLDLEQRKTLISKCPSDLANLVEAMCLLPLRPGAFADLKVGSFDSRLSTLNVGKDKSGHDRLISLPPRAANFFKNMCVNKLPTAHILTRANGKHWEKDYWKTPFKQAVADADLPPATTLYALRHSAITDLIHSGVDTLTVSQVSGTSIAMIEKHYGHLTHAHTKKSLEALML